MFSALVQRKRKMASFVTQGVCCSEAFTLFTRYRGDIYYHNTHVYGRKEAVACASCEKKSRDSEKR